MSNVEDITEGVGFKTFKGMQLGTQDDLEKIAADSNPDDMYAMLEQKKRDFAFSKEAAISVSGNSGPNYPSPLLSLSDMEIPDRVIHLFKWCKYFFVFDPLIASAINAMANFPITSILFDESPEFANKQSLKESGTDGEETKAVESKQLQLIKHNFNEKLNIMKLLVEIGIDYFLYGNCFVYGEMVQDPESKMYNWDYIMRIPPDKIQIEVDSKNKHKYKWLISDRIRRIVKDKLPGHDSIHPKIKKAVLESKAVVINSDYIYHFSRPSDSMGETAWGVPVVAHVMKLIMYRNVLRQAQEAIAREHIVPLRIFYLNPNPNISTSQMKNDSGTSVTEALSGQIRKWVTDPNYKIVSPLPVGMTTAGGHGRGLLLGPEIEAVQAEILAGMNLPREFIFGGVSYSGSNISLKITENFFATYRLSVEHFMNDFLIKRLLVKNGFWKNSDDNDKLIKAKLSELKMQDDAQQKEIIRILNQSEKVTDEMLYKSIGIDPHKMKSELKSERAEKLAIQVNMKADQIKSEIGLQKIQLVEQVKNMAFQLKLARLIVEDHDCIDKIQSIDELEKALEIYPLTPEDCMQLSNFVLSSAGVMAAPMQGEPMSDPNQMVGPQSQSPEVQAQQVEQSEQTQQPPVENNAQGNPSEYTESNIRNLVSKLVSSSSSERTKLLHSIGSADGKLLGFVVDNAMPHLIANLDTPELQDLMDDFEDMGLTDYVSEISDALGDSEAEDEANTSRIDMRPMPEQKPPRRDSLG